MMPPEPLDRAAKLAALLTLIAMAAMVTAAVHFYFILPERIPTHFNWKGEPDTYGGKAMVLLLPLAFLPAPIVFLLIAKFRFKLINDYPYLINLPAFLLKDLPPERVAYWVNRYFSALLTFGCAISYYLLFIEVCIFIGCYTGRLPAWFNVLVVATPFPLVLAFLLHLRRLSREFARLNSSKV